MKLHTIELKYQQFPPFNTSPSSPPANPSLSSPSYTASQNPLCLEQFNTHLKLTSLPDGHHLHFIKYASQFLLPYKHQSNLVNLLSTISMCQHPRAPWMRVIVTWGLVPYTKNFGLCPEGHVEHRKSLVGERPWADPLNCT